MNISSFSSPFKKALFTSTCLIFQFKDTAIAGTILIVYVFVGHLKLGKTCADSLHFYAVILLFTCLDKYIIDIGFEYILMEIHLLTFKNTRVILKYWISYYNV